MIATKLHFVRQEEELKEDFGVKKVGKRKLLVQAQRWLAREAAAFKTLTREEQERQQYALPLQIHDEELLKENPVVVLFGDSSLCSILQDMELPDVERYLAVLRAPPFQIQTTADLATRGLSDKEIKSGQSKHSSHQICNKQH